MDLWPDANLTAYNPSRYHRLDDASVFFSKIFLWNSEKAEFNWRLANFQLCYQIQCYKNIILWKKYNHIINDNRLILEHNCLKSNWVFHKVPLRRWAQLMLSTWNMIGLWRLWFFSLLTRRSRYTIHVIPYQIATALYFPH